MAEGVKVTFYRDFFLGYARPPMKETMATLGFMLFFTGSMIDIAGSTFVTQGGTPAPVYFRVGLIELIGSVIFAIGIYLIIKTR